MEHRFLLSVFCFSITSLLYAALPSVDLTDIDPSLESLMNAKELFFGEILEQAHDSSIQQKTSVRGALISCRYGCGEAFIYAKCRMRHEQKHEAKSAQTPKSIPKRALNCKEDLTNV